MPYLFFFVVILRFDCLKCGRRSEQKRALGVEQNTGNAIGEAIHISDPRCQHCNAPPGRGSDLTFEIQQATAQYLEDLGLPIPGGS